MTAEERREYMREYYRKHKTRLRKYGHSWWKRNGWMENVKRKHRYSKDPAYRESELERKRKARYGLA